jgi:hypothetical protein
VENLRFHLRRSPGMCFFVLRRVYKRATKHEKGFTMPRTSSVALEADHTPMCVPEGQRMPGPPHNPEVFEVIEFCGWARISRSVAFKEIAEGRLIVRRVGRKSLVPIESARAWLASLPTTREA